MTRPWRFPDLRNGATICHITDTHHGGADNADWVQNHHARVVTDLEALAPYYSAVVHTGDSIDWFIGEGNNSTGLNTEELRAMQTARFVAWRNSIVSRTGKPVVVAVGNHDIQHMTGTPISDDAAKWAAGVGVPSQKYVTDLGQVKVITVGPDSWRTGTGGSPTLSAQTISFLRDELQAAGKPCFIASHTTVAGVKDNTELVKCLSEESNAIGWLSGHNHRVPWRTSSPVASILSVGYRTMFAINGPACAGARPGEGEGTGISDPQERQYAQYGRNIFGDWTTDDAQLPSTCSSTFLTLISENELQVRHRDHLSRSWMYPMSAQMQTPVQTLYR